MHTERSTNQRKELRDGKESCQLSFLKAVATQMMACKFKLRTLPRSRVHVWLIRISTSILLWTCLIQLTAWGQLWHPPLIRSWPLCFTLPHSHALAVRPIQLVQRPRRAYKNNGYLMVSCNGGLNQMRAAICDMVTIAKHLNVTMIVPELDKTSFWADPSDFGDIFDVNHFISSLADEVRVIKKLPIKFNQTETGTIRSLPPVSWSNDSYYRHQILPMLKKHKVLHLNKTDARLANNGLPLELQMFRCRVNYHALQFTSRIQGLGEKLVKMLLSKGPFLVLHLRYEMDMLAFSGCTHGCSDEETRELTKMRYAYPWWKEKVIDSEQKRKDGLCPLTPEETALILKALGYDRSTQIYIAAGEIYNGTRRMTALHSTFSNIVRKEMLLTPEELKPLVNHSSQMAALDYLVSVASDVFIPTYDGNMAKVVEGHRRFLGFRKTILLNRKKLINLIDHYESGALTWNDFVSAVKQEHQDRLGLPCKRQKIPDKPKEEDYFYANPHECLSGPHVDSY
ncbi:hypothetical protein O6H91_13G018500 [Diphasiastrum complanatum]|uniref:Uncharacterized protein n=1 Tax=Diphasiastrum complanatum TaxID=34168 RepID=A0ACC2BSK3_DIPCM|nr:hypothetical protein O6H91_Y388300 [Diphasiastrum complanatum]KAJ7532754.1 hypothetical protein O6H91_13G018500 [Diphasiastrum complanatum]